MCVCVCVNTHIRMILISYTRIYMCVYVYSHTLYMGNSFLQFCNYLLFQLAKYSLHIRLLLPPYYFQHLCDK